MSRNSKTKDEICLIKLYEQAKVKGDYDKVWSLEEIKTLLSQPKNRTYDIVKNLAQANFLKKVESGTYSITERGISLAKACISD